MFVFSVITFPKDNLPLPPYTDGMVAYFCHHLSDVYVDLSDNYVHLSDIYIHFSDDFVDLSDNNHS